MKHSTRNTALQLFTAVLLAGAALWSPAAKAENVRVIHRDLGGNVMERWHEVTSISLSGTEVQIRGQCLSACTMYLSVPNLCVSPEAVVGFHGPRSQTTGNSLSDSSASQIMAMHYPVAIRDWFLQEAQYLQGSQVAYISGQQIIDLGTRSCSGPS